MFIGKPRAAQALYCSHVPELQQAAWHYVARSRYGYMVRIADYAIARYAGRTRRSSRILSTTYSCVALYVLHFHVATRLSPRLKHSSAGYLHAI